MSGNALETAIYGTLTGGTALTALLAGGSASIYNGQPPREGTMPWVQFSFAAGRDEESNLTPGDSIQRYIYMVKGVASSLGVAGSIADQIHVLLNNVNMNVANVTCLSAKREIIVRYQEIDPAGHVIGHAGGEYAFRLGKT